MCSVLIDLNRGRLQAPIGKRRATRRSTNLVAQRSAHLAQGYSLAFGSPISPTETTVDYSLHRDSERCVSLAVILLRFVVVVFGTTSPNPVGHA